MSMMRAYLIFLVSVSSVLAQTKTSVVGVLRCRDGVSNFNGSVQIQNNDFVTGAGFVVSAQVQMFGVPNGSFSIALNPTDSATPDGSAYQVMFREAPNSSCVPPPNETWWVPVSSAPVSRALVLLRPGTSGERVGTGNLGFSAGLPVIADQLILGNISGGSAVPIGITADQVATFLAGRFLSAVPATLPGTTSVNGTTIPASVTLLQKIAGGTAALNQTNLGTSSLAANTCTGAYVLTATGTLATDGMVVAPNANIATITGYGALSTDGLTIRWYPVSDNVDWVVCNQTASAIAISNSIYPSINYVVIR